MHLVCVKMIYVFKDDRAGRPCASVLRNKVSVCSKLREKNQIIINSRKYVLCNTNINKTYTKYFV